MERFIGTVCDASGNPLSGVTVTVKKAGTSVNASLFSDEGVTTKANPFTNDANGSYEFYAPNGRYDVSFSKTGVTFTAADTTDLLLFDPRDDPSAYSHFWDDFLSIFTSGSDRISDGNHWRVGGGSVTRVAGDSTYKNGWVDVIESAAAAGSMFVSDDANALAKLFVPTGDAMALEVQVEKVGDAVTGTRRVGLGDASLTADPANGIFIRQIDAANAFLVCRSASVESTLDLGATLNDPKKIRLVITTASVRAFLDGTNKGTVTTNIPTAILGLSAGGGATASAAGLRLGYVEAWAVR